MFFVVALLAVAAAAAGPVYLAAADQSVLAHVVVPPAPQATGLEVNEQPGHPVLEATFRRAVGLEQRSPNGRRFFGQAIYTSIAPAEIVDSGQSVIALADVVNRSGDCPELSIASGTARVAHASSR